MKKVIFLVLIGIATIYSCQRDSIGEESSEDFSSTQSEEKFQQEFKEPSLEIQALPGYGREIDQEEIQFINDIWFGDKGPSEAIKSLPGYGRKIGADEMMILYASGIGNTKGPGWTAVCSTGGYPLTGWAIYHDANCSYYKFDADGAIDEVSEESALDHCSQLLQ